MAKTRKKVLFIIKQRFIYGEKTKAYGLYNSCDFVSRKLIELGVDSKVVQVVDNNCIDKEVHAYKPTDVFIEALWVVPDKFKVLAKLHPNVTWHIRMHSKTPFIATEGNAFNWLNQYMSLCKEGIKIKLSANSIDFFNDLKSIYGTKNVSYSPNLYYPSHDYDFSCNVPDIRTNSNEFHIGIFGALRPLKNHLQQALWSIQFGKLIKRPIVVHINVSEHEAKSNTNGVANVLFNIRNLFSEEAENCRLYEHPWYSHSDFLGVVKQMDLGLQVSYSETFNITAADFVYMNVPIVVSDEIKFVNPFSRINTNSSKQAMTAMMDSVRFGSLGLNYFNRYLLNKTNRKAVNSWKELLDINNH